MLHSVFTVTLLFGLQLSFAKWGYDKPGMNTSHWAEKYPECGGQQQSPIDIPMMADSSMCNQVLELNWTTESVRFGVINVGKTLVAYPFDISHSGGSAIANLQVLHHTNDTNIRLANPFYNTYESKINKEYCFDSLHLHWGRDSESGSEHTVNGKMYPLELHFVHYSCDYANIGEAVNAYVSGSHNTNDEDDYHVLSVVGVFFEIGEANPFIDMILSDDILEGVKSFDPESSQEQLIKLFYTQEVDPRSVLPESKEFVAYRGSLTTPTCLETVRWNVMKDAVTVSEEQMERFRQLQSSSNVNDTQQPNWRPVQPLFDRIVYECQETIDAELIESDKYQDDSSEKTYKSSKAWDYKDPDSWQYTWAECGGAQQSPIDIPLNDACDEDMLQLEWTSEKLQFGVRNTGYSLLAVPLEISHGGASASDLSQLEVLHHTNDTNVRLVNAFYETYEAPVNKEYCFDSLHMHWGTTNMDGSEHTVDGKFYPLEVHLVHYSCDYRVVGDAVHAYVNNHNAGLDDNHVLGVIGILFEIGAPNAALEALLNDEVLAGVQYYDAVKQENMLQMFYTEFDLADLLPDDRSFVAYKGSLTTPACFETVRWHVMRQTMTVSPEQMRKLRMLMASSNDDYSMAPNWRPTLDLGNRQLYACQSEVAQQTVEKNYQYLSDSENKADKWQFVAVVFVFLFGIAFMCIIHLVYQLNCTKKRRESMVAHERLTNVPSGRMVYDEPAMDDYKEAEAVETTTHTEPASTTSVSVVPPALVSSRRILI